MFILQIRSIIIKHFICFCERLTLNNSETHYLHTKTPNRQWQEGNAEMEGFINNSVSLSHCLLFIQSGPVQKLPNHKDEGGVQIYAILHIFLHIARQKFLLGIGIPLDWFTMI